MVMPKKPEEEKKQNVTVGLTEEEIQRVDALAKKIGYSRSKTGRNLLLVGLDLIEDFERFKIISLSIFIRDRLPKFKTGFRKLVERIEEEEREA